jgi:hypothetical protein
MPKEEEVKRKKRKKTGHDITGGLRWHLVFIAHCPWHTGDETGRKSAHVPFRLSEIRTIGCVQDPPSIAPVKKGKEIIGKKN